MEAGRVSRMSDEGTAGPTNESDWELGAETSPSDREAAAPQPWWP